MGPAQVNGPTRARSESIILFAATAYALAYVAWVFLGHFGGHRVVVSDVATWPLLIAAIALTWRRGCRRQGRARTGWWAIALGTAAWLGGEVLWFHTEVIQHREPFPSIADPFYLAFYPLVFVGLVLLPVQAPRRQDRLTLVLDTSIVMVSALMATWYLVIGPTVAAGGSWSTTLLAVAYPTGDLILLLGVLRVLLRRPRRSAVVSLRTLALGLAAMVVADVAFARLDLVGAYRPGSYPDALWAIAIVSIAAAAWLGSGPRADSRFETPETLKGAHRISVLPFAASLLGIGLLVHQAARPKTGSLAALTVGVVVVVLLVATRQVALQRDVGRLLTDLEVLATVDPLTGLANRRRFFGRGMELLARAREDQLPCAVLITDLDHFKLVNDHHGHATGDLVLRRVGEACTAVLPASGLVGRLGGDEFAFVLPGYDAIQARAVAEALCQRVADGPTFGPPERPLRVTVTVGVAASDGTSSLDDLLLIADGDLYARKAGRPAPAPSVVIETASDPETGPVRSHR